MKTLLVYGHSGTKIYDGEIEMTLAEDGFLSFIGGPMVVVS